MMKRMLPLLLAIILLPLGRALAEEAPTNAEALQNERLSLSFAANYSELRLTDRLNGKTWSSSVQADQIPTGVRVNRTWQKRSNSLVLINYTDAQANSGDVKTTDLLSAAYTATVVSDNGADVFSVAYALDELSMGFQLDFTLKNDSLIVSIPDERVVENGIYQWVSLALMPFFGSTNDRDEGYYLYPNGCGEIYRFKEQRYRSNALVTVTMPVYAPRITQQSGFPFGAEGASLSIVPENSAMIPAYGVRQNGAGIAVVVESGDADCGIVMTPAGVSLPVNSIYPRLTYRNNYGVRGQNISVAGSTEFSYISLLVDKDRRKGDRSVRYTVLKDECADYGGMAQAVRQSYLDRNILVEHVAGTPEVVLDILVGVEEQQVLTKELVTLTAFAQAEEMVAYFIAQGYDALNLNLKGWNAKGVLGYPSYLPASSAAGGENELKKLVEFCNENGVPVQLQFNGLKLRDDNRGFTVLTDTARDGNGYSYTIPMRNHTYYLQNTAFRDKLMTNLRNFASSLGEVGLTAEDIGGYLYDDFSGQATMRSTLAEQWREALTSRDAITGGNACLWGNALLLREIPDAGDLSNFGDTTVPFYQMVVHGSMAYTGQPVNLFYDSQGQLLKMLEYGFVPCFELTDGSTTALMNTEYNLLFTGKFSSWSDDIAANRACFTEYARLTAGKAFTAHRREAEGVWLSVFEDVYLWVNYTDNDWTSPYGVVKSGSYLLIEEEKQ